MNLVKAASKMAWPAGLYAAHVHSEDAHANHGTHVSFSVSIIAYKSEG